MFNETESTNFNQTEGFLEGVVNLDNSTRSDIEVFYQIDYLVKVLAQYTSCSALNGYLQMQAMQAQGNITQTNDTSAHS